MRFDGGKRQLTKIGNIVLAAAASILWSAPLRAGEASLSLPNVVVGYHLEVAGRVVLSDPAPNGDYEIRLQSSDPGKLVIAKTPDQPGAPSIVLHVQKGARVSPEFWFQALDSSGTVNCIAEGQGYAKGVGPVTLSPSGIAIAGPHMGASFPTTTGGPSSKITIYSVRLDANMAFVEEQAVAGNGPLEVRILSSNGSVGRVVDSPVSINTGTSYSPSRFQPAGEGETTLTIAQPSGFHTPDRFVAVTASVRKPGLAISGELYIGHNLEVSGVLALGEAASDDGLDVTLTSDDPSRLLLSATETGNGAKSIHILVPAHQTSARYYLQSLADSGTVKYTATAQGFQSRTAPVMLAPSGIVVTPIWQGPPDEGQVLRPGTPGSNYRFMVSLANSGPLKLVVWTAQLDPVTHRSADITIQPLRAGLSVTVPLQNNNPGVAKTPDSVTIQGGTDHAEADFVATTDGSVEISVVTPADFTRSANSTSVVGIVRK